MTDDPTQPQQNPFPTPERGPAPGQPDVHPVRPASQLTPSYIPPTVAAAVASPTRRSGVSAGTMAFVAAVVVAAAGLGFAGGRLTAPPAAAARGFNGQFTAGGPNASGNPGRAGQGLGFAGTTSIDGQVTAIANGSITVQTTNGQSVTLQIPSSVTYHAQAPATSSDVAVGTRVQVSVGRPNFRAEASGGPAPSGEPANGQGNGGQFQFTVTDITVLAK